MVSKVGCKGQSEVYISPESLSMLKYRDMLLTDQYQKNLTVFAIDEVHCMLTWQKHCV